MLKTKVVCSPKTLAPHTPFLTHQVKPIKEQRESWDWHVAVAAVWHSELCNYLRRPPSVAGTGQSHKELKYQELSF